MSPTKFSRQIAPRALDTGSDAISGTKLSLVTGQTLRPLQHPRGPIEVQMRALLQRQSQFIDLSMRCAAPA